MRNPITLLALTIATSGISHAALTIPANAADAGYVVTRTNIGGDNTYDGGTDGTGSVNIKDSTTVTIMQVGGTTGNSEIGVGIIPFLLPTLGAGQSFGDVSFSVYSKLNAGTIGSTVDLYGLGRRASATVLAVDYYVGALDTTDASLLQAGFIVDGTTDGIQSTSASGTTNLTSYLNTQYAGGTGAGEYVFLRLNYDETFTSGAIRYDVRAQDFATESGRPLLTYTIVPEPSSTLLVAGFAALGLIRRSRH